MESSTGTAIFATTELSTASDVTELMTVLDAPSLPESFLDSTNPERDSVPRETLSPRAHSRLEAEATRPVDSKQDKPYGCPLCAKSFRRRSDLQRHQRQHESPKYSCPYCDRTFSRKDKAIQHTKSRHPDEYSTSALVHSPDHHESPRPTSITPIEASPAYIGLSSSDTQVIVEFLSLDPAVSYKTKQLYKLLISTVISAFLKDRHPAGILQCIGYFEDTHDARFGLISKVPDRATKAPRSLEKLLRNNDSSNRLQYSLNDRIQLACDIATGISVLHSKKIVHGDIKPKNILIFNEEGPADARQKELGHPFLVGFDQMRYLEEGTQRIGVGVQDHVKQGVASSTKHNLLYDIYSLGLVLLEIAIWRPLSMYETMEDKTIKDKDNQGSIGDLLDKRYTAASKEMRQLLCSIAKSQVPPRMGSQYTNAVIKCFDCMEGFGDVDGTNDTDSVLYVLKVLRLLEAISI